MSQSSLFSFEKPVPRREFIELNFLNEDSKGATNDLLESMRSVGQLHPVLLEQVGSEYRVRAGNRRIETARKLGWEDIDAEIYQGLTETQWALILAGDHNRKRNPVDEARQFSLLATTMTIDEIHANTGVPVQTIRAALTLNNLPHDVLALIGSKHLALGVAEAAAKLKSTHFDAAVQAIREAAHRDRAFTAKHLKEITVARVSALGKSLRVPQAVQAPIFPPRTLLAAEVRELCQRRGVPLQELLTDLQTNEEPSLAAG